MASSTKKRRKDIFVHCDSRVAYIEDYVPGPGCNLDHFHSELEVFCDCDSCEAKSCACIDKQGMDYKDDLLAESKLAHDAGCIIECNDRCNCDLSCPNRLIQRGPNSDIEIKSSEHKGYGVFTTRPIPKGGFICEYIGEVIDKGEAEKRYTIGDHRKYITKLKEVCPSSNTVVETYVDATWIGNVGRYINHSCDPNCILLVARIGSPFPRLCIFAIKDIKEGEEISYSYCPDSSIVGTTACKCKSLNCKGFLPFDKINSAFGDYHMVYH